MTSKEAFELLKRYEAELSSTKKTEVSYDDVISARYEIGQLVLRDTPSKIVDTGIGGSYCNKCGKSIHYDGFGNRNNFCGGCGQRLKWSDNNE